MLGNKQISFFSDVDECFNGNNSCHTNASCFNLIGSYDCDCLPGFMGDGFNCSSKHSPGQLVLVLGSFLSYTRH